MRSVCAAFVSFFLFGAINYLAPSPATAVTIDTVPVGNPGNAGNPGKPPEYFFFPPPGAVGYSYQIAKLEVTNLQYVEFLNAKATSDPLQFYNPAMASDPRGGIMQDEVSGNFVYTAKPNMANKPVNFVNVFDAMRFVNWLNNGQGAGDTESGAYTLSGGAPWPTNARGNSTIHRNAGATWYLPSHDEWYKAAYYDPRSTSQGGPPGDDHYWEYATQSDVAPILAAADSSGNISNPAANVANYNNGADWNGLDGNLTTVGSAGPLSTSFYGTFDQAGNVSEFTDTVTTILLSSPPTFTRDVPGNSYSAVNYGGAIVEYFDNVAIGFRLVMIPEPGSLALAVAGLVVVTPLMLRLRRRRAKSP
jgi:formylglycine-generating enzyme required for sulfatase activity